MAIKYDVHSIHNVLGSGEKKEFVYLLDQPAHSQAAVEKELERRSVLTRGGVQAALTALRDMVTRELVEGRKANIPGIGTLSLSAEAQLPEGKTMEKVRANYLRIKGIRFRPDASLLKEIRRQVRFERSEYTTVSLPQTEEEVWTLIEGYLSNHPCISRRGMECEFSMSKHVALKWLRHFTNAGKMKKEGAPNSPVYLLADKLE